MKLNFSNIHRIKESYRTNIFLFAIIVTLVGLGLNILLASSSFLAQKAFGDPYFYLKKQAMFSLLGTGLCIAISQTDYQLWKKLTWPCYAVTMILLVLVLLVGKKAGGATRWIEIAGFSIQPSDLAKFSTILVLARLFSKSKEIKWGGVFTGSLALLAPVFLIVIEPDFGTGFHLLIAAASMLLLTGYPIRLMLLSVVLAIPVLFYSIVNVPYRWDRVKAFLDPYTFRFEGAYQLVASFKAFQAGGFWGKGFGEGIRRHNLQARHTDFILAVVAEDLGFLGVTILLILLFAIIGYGLYLMFQVDDNFGRLLGCGILFLFATQVIINVAVTMGLVPTTGINLPLISNGGTSLVTYLAMFGIVLSITRIHSNKINDR